MVTIKKCEVKDLDLLHEIAIESYNDTYQYLWKDGGKLYLETFYQKDTFKEELTASDVFYFLVFDDNEAAGYFKLKENGVASYPNSDCIELDKLYLLKKFTGKGIGKTIMNFIFSFTTEKKRPILWLKVMETSPARSVYEKNGFIMIEKKDLDYPEIVAEYASIMTMVKEM